MELGKDKLQEIVEQAKPGAKVAERAQRDTIPGLDAAADLADIEAIDVVALRAKYLKRVGAATGADVDAHGAAGHEADEAPGAASDLGDPQEQLVDIEYHDGDTTRTKTLIVDTVNEEVIGEQG